MIKAFIAEIVEIFKELVTKEEFWFIVFVAGLAGLLFLPFIPLDILAEIFIKTFLSLWWLWVTIFLFFSFRNLLLAWRREIYRNNAKLTLLEIKIPTRLEKDAEAMENVLAVLNSFMKSPGNVKEKYWEGIVNNVFSLEIVRKNGETRFFIAAPSSLKKVVESAFFSYYPEAELEEVSDYVEDLPASHEEASFRNLDVWGGEMILEKEEAYPIKTYKHFENTKESKKFDPLMEFLEVMSRLEEEEFLGIQILISPVPSIWKEQFSSTLDKLKKKGQSTNQTTLGVPHLSPGELEVLKIVENNLNKPAFLTLVRILYTAPQGKGEKGLAIGGILGAFNQFRGANFNGFKMNKNTVTSVDKWIKPIIPFIFAKRKLSDKISGILYKFKKRITPSDEFWRKVLYSYPFFKITDSKMFYFSVESLASIFHLPTSAMGIWDTAYIKKIPSRKVSPPIGLPIFGGEEEIEKFT